MGARSYRYCFDGRDRSVLEFDLPTTPPILARVAIFWDADRDQRAISVLEALRFRTPMMLTQIIALREQQGRIDWWCTPPNAAETQRALSSAADAALHPRHHWHVNPPKLVPIKHGAPYCEALPSDDPVRAANKRHELGVVGARS